MDRQRRVVGGFASVFFVFIIIGCGVGETGFRILDVSPSRNGSVPVDTKITVKFSEKIDPTTLTSQSFWLLNGTSHGKVKGEIQYDEKTKTATLIPSRLVHESHYTVTVEHSITNASGEHLGDQAREWGFFTQERPPIFNHQPGIGAVDVSALAKVRVDLERPVDPNTANPQNFMLVALGVPIAGNVEAQGTQLIFSPTQELQLSTQYSVILQSTILDIDGLPLFPLGHSWTFTTALERSSTLHIGSANDESINDAVLLSDGNIIIGGDWFAADPPSTITQPSFTPPDNQAYIAKVALNGNELWHTKVGTQNFDSLVDLSLLSDNTIVATGQSDNFVPFGPSEMLSSIFVARLSADGGLLWQESFGASNNHAMSAGVAVDAQNNVYIAGSTMGAVAGYTNAGEHDLILAKYSMDGQQQWVKQYGAENDEVADAIVLNGEMITVVATETTMLGPPGSGPTQGAGMGGPLFNPVSKVALHKFDLAGTSLGRNEIVSEGHTIIGKPTVSAVGDLILPGVVHNGFDSQSGKSQTQAFVMKLDPNGQILWRKDWPDDGLTEAQIVAVDAQQNIFTGGLVHKDLQLTLPVEPIEPPKNTIKLVLRMYSEQSTTPLWTKEIAAENHAQFSALLQNVNGEFIALGSAHGGVDGNTSLGQQDGFILRFDAQGNLK